MNIRGGDPSAGFSVAGGGTNSERTNRDLPSERAAEIREDVRFSPCSLYLHIFSVRIIVQWNAPEIKFRRSTYEETGSGEQAPLDVLSLSLSSSLSCSPSLLFLPSCLA